LEGSAFITRGYLNNNYDSRHKRGKPWCDHCNKSGHVKETCWKIHGKLANWKSSRLTNDKDRHANTISLDDNRDKNTNLSTETSRFTKEQLEILQKLLNQNPLSHSSMLVSGYELLAQKGKFSKALTISKRYSSLWIINSRASDHMIGDATLFNEYKCNKNPIVRIADGSSSQVKGIGLNKISRDMILNSILHVPKLDCNLISISKLTRDLNCVAKFFPNLCIFQDLDTAKKIGSAKMCLGFYLLNGFTLQKGQT